MIKSGFKSRVGFLITDRSWTKWTCVRVQLVGPLSVAADPFSRAPLQVTGHFLCVSIVPKVKYLKRLAAAVKYEMMSQDR